jgi:iron complex outermembrane recepter protein
LTGDRSSEKFAVPKWLATIGVRYVVPMSFGEIAGNLDYNYQSEVVLEPSALDLAAVTQDDYGLLNGRLSVSFDQADVEVAVFSKNMLDEEYKASAVTNEASVGFSFVTAGVPRTVGIQLTKRF